VLAVSGPASAQTANSWADAAAQWSADAAQWRAEAAQAAPAFDAWRAAAAAQADAAWQGDQSARDAAQQARDAAQRDRDAAQRDRDSGQRGRDREMSQYDAGQSSLDAAKWDNAIQHFDAVIDLKGPKADGALYWKAYAQNRLGQRPEALTTIGTLTKDYPKSRYISDAKALEVEVRSRAGGVNPAQESDEDLKLLALQSLQNTDSDQAVPMLEKVLHGTGSPRLKQRAMFVLAQTNSPKAREVLVGIAKGGSNPDLQMKAIQYLGLYGGHESKTALADVYASTSDVDVKKRILMSYMTSGNKDALLSAAQTEPNAELRAEAVRQLGNMGAHEELWALYQKDTSVDVKKQIIRAMFTGGSSAHLIELAKSEQNPELRLLAVRNLGVMGSRQTSDALVEIYGSSKDAEIRKAVINSLFIQGNADGLVALARKESDPAMKKEMVQKLSVMHSKVATDYLIEILNGK
jgi:HEAT repeat protein